MKKKFSILTGIVVVLGICTAYAAKFNGWPFSAPVVDGEGSVVDPKQGNIIFDWISSADGIFKGYNGTNWVQFATSSTSVVPGTIVAYAGASAPSGYLVADGSAVSRTTYADLFTAIGTSYGSGDGSTTFNVPDLRGRFLRGVDGGTARDPDAASRTAMNSGGNTGNNVGSVQADDFKTHTHSVTAPVTGDSGSAVAAHWNVNTTPNSGNASVTSASAGGNETRPVNAYVNYIIKY